jgi:hypothetical protein
MSQQNCEFSGVYKGGGGTWQAAIRVGSDIVATLDLGSVTDGRQFSLNYPCNGVTSVGFRTTASASQLTVDELYFGVARNIGTVAQATFVGGMEQEGATGCLYSQNTSTSYSDFVSLGTSTGCNAWTVTSNGPGVISAIGNNDHRLVYTNMPPGNYRFVLTGSFVASSSTSAYCGWALFDGTTRYQPQYNGINSIGSPATPSLSFDVSYTTAGTRTFTIQASDNTPTSNCYWDNTLASGAIRASWKIYRFPTREEQVLRPDQVAWRVDANIGGANPDLGLGNVSNYTEITNGSLDLVNNSGPGVIPAQIPCSGTNPPTGLTCSAGNESIGVSFNLPAAGDVLACVSFSHAAGAPSGSDINAAFQLVETPNNAQTILQEGKVRVQSGSGTLGSNIMRALRVCGNFSFTSAGQKTIRLMYEQLASGSPTSSVIAIDRSSSVGQRDMHWEVYPLNTYQPAPLLIGSVISGSSGILRVEYASISSTGVVSGESSDLFSGNCSVSDTSLYTCTLVPGVFSSAPICTPTFVGDISGVSQSASITVQSNTTIAIRTLAGGAKSAQSSQVVCIGPR